MKYRKLIFIVMFLGCSKVNFTTAPVADQQVQAPPAAEVPKPPMPTPPPGSSPTPAPDCTGTIEKTTQNLRIMFMVDNSGSTFDTDPDQFIRVQTIKNFIKKYGNKVNFTYSFGFFSSDTYIFNIEAQKFVNIQMKGIPRSVFGNSHDLSQALNIFGRLDGSGDTNYAPALNAVKGMISQDSLGKSSWNYVLIFMSDGQPSDISEPVAENLERKIEQLTKAAENNSRSITVSTVLFDPLANSQYFSSAENLKAIASSGKGQFFDTNFPPIGGLAIDDIISVPGKICPKN